VKVKRGEVWLADLNPTRGSEQAGVRPVAIFQNDTINNFTTTVITIPLTTNLRRAALPSSVSIRQGEGGVREDSVVLCHQLRLIDKTRLQKRLGTLSQSTISVIESRVLFTLGIVI